MKTTTKLVKFYPRFYSFEIPSDWNETKFDEKLEIIKGVSYSSNDIKDIDSENILINLGCFKKQGGFNINGIKYYVGKIEEKGRVNGNDLLIANTDVTLDGEVVGYPIKVPYFGLKKIIHSMDTSKIKIKNDEILKDFLYYYLSTNFVHNCMRSFCSGTTVLHLDLNSVRKMKLFIPPIKEQQKIASILSEVDGLIHKTDQIIKHTQRLKKGVMNKLFSLKPSWKIFKVEEIKANTPNSITMGPFGSNITRDNFVPSGVPVIRGVNLTKEPFNMEGFVFLTDKKADELRSANAFAGDLVFTHRGTLGQVGLIPDNTKYRRYVVSQSQMKLTCDLAKVDPLYVYYFFVSSKGRNALLSNIHGTGVPAIGQPTTTLRRIKIPIPPLSEQHKISNSLLSLNQLVETHKKRKKIIENLKKGMMQQLLAGKIRVKF